MDSIVRPSAKVNHIANNRNTYAKRQREVEKRQRADDKRKKREDKASRPAGGEPRLFDPSDLNSRIISENSSESSEPGLSG